MKYQKSTFVVVPNKHILEGQKSEIQSLYFWVCSHADKDGKCTPRRKLLAREAGISLRMVDKCIPELEKLGILHKQNQILNRKKLVNIYQLLLSEKDMGVAHTVREGSAHGALGVAHTVRIELNPIRTQSLINTSGTAKAVPDSKERDVIKSVFGAFAEWNKAAFRWFKIPVQREAAERLVANYGVDLVLKVISFLPKSNRIAYLPMITTPLKLEEKWSELEAGLHKERSKLKAKIRVVV